MRNFWAGFHDTGGRLKEGVPGDVGHSHHGCDIGGDFEELC